MRYNIDCVREILLCLEKELSLVKISENVYENKNIRISDLFHIIGKDYSEEDILYSADKLDEAGYITVSFSSGDGACVCDSSIVTSITFKGHEFIENIRDSQSWKRIKKAGKAAGSFALSIVGEIARNVALGAAQAFLKQNSSAL